MENLLYRVLSEKAVCSTDIDMAASEMPKATGLSQNVYRQWISRRCVVMRLDCNMGVGRGLECGVMSWCGVLCMV